jgi:hypothetical protein
VWTNAIPKRYRQEASKRSIRNPPGPYISSFKRKEDFLGGGMQMDSKRYYKNYFLFVELVLLLLLGCLSISCISSKQLYEEKSKRLEAERDAGIRLCEEQSKRLEAERDAAIRDRDREVRLRKELEVIIERNKSEIVTLKESLDSFRQRLQKAEITNIMECQAQLEGCRALKEEAERKAYSNGMLAIWEALSISALPEEKGLVFKDYYLTVNLRIKGNNVYSFRVKTAQSQRGFSTALSTAMDIVTIASYVK